MGCWMAAFQRMPWSKLLFTNLSSLPPTLLTPSLIPTLVTHSLLTRSSLPLSSLPPFSPAGWWFVTCTDTFSEGWVPANYLEPIDKDREEEEGLNEVLNSGTKRCSRAWRTNEAELVLSVRVVCVGMCLCGL